MKAIGQMLIAVLVLFMIGAVMHSHPSNGNGKPYVQPINHTCRSTITPGGYWSEECVRN